MLMDCCRPIFVLVLSLLATSLHLINIVVAADDNDLPYDQNYYVPKDPWMKDHVQVLDQNRQLSVSLDKYTGSAGFNSWHKYGSGWFTMKIKMPQKDSTAIITTFYLQSEKYEVRDEIDFELLGGNGDKRRPYVLHTNIFVNGVGGREQKMHFWFDPTADFHNYTLLWNSHQILFYVDEIPVRMFKNSTKDGGSYPTRAMNGFGRLWNGTWASGGVDVNWNDGPFVAEYRGFSITGCQTQTTNDPQCYSSKYWWNANKYWTLDAHQTTQYKDVRTKYLIYDYCSQSHAPECQYDP